MVDGRIKSAPVKIWEVFLGDRQFEILILLIVFSVFTVSLGLVICTYSNDLRQSGVISSPANISFAMFGGCFWTRDIIPEKIKKQ